MWGWLLGLGGLLLLASAGGSDRSSTPRRKKREKQAGNLEDVQVLDAVFDPATLSSGMYVASSATPAYAILRLATKTDKTIQVVGETPRRGGTKALTVLVTRSASAPQTTPPKPGTAPAPPQPQAQTPLSGVDGVGVVTGGRQITIGREFFLTALNDYRDWREKWWREAIQNSVDAGATRVDIKVFANTTGPNIGTMTISCADNGTGMDEDTLLNKFLVLGGTTKRGASGTAGGFGKAKELLVLPWLSWKIETRDLVATGSGTGYDVSSRPFEAGTKITVVMSDDLTTSSAAAINFITKCDLPRTNFFVDGKQIYAQLKPERLVLSLPGKAEVYFNPFPPKKQRTGDEESSMLVRTRGLYMFNRWVADEVGGRVLVELTGPSIELLTANRDGLRDEELVRAIDGFTNKIAADTKSALQKKSGIVRKIWRGTGKFRPSDDMANRLLELLRPSGSAPRTLDPSDVASVIAQIDALYAGSGGGIQEGVPIGAAVKVMLESQMKGEYHVEAALKQSVWKPDFFLVNEVEGYKVPAAFYPETMSPSVLRLLRVWTELCRFVLIQLGSPTEYGVGFVISDDTMAMFVKEEGSRWLLLNPFKMVDGKRATRIYAPGKPEDLNQIYASAVHEATHVADGINYHDEGFAAALTRNIALTIPGVKRLKRIVDAIPLTPSTKQSAQPAQPAADRFPYRMALVYWKFDFPRVIRGEKPTVGELLASPPAQVAYNPTASWLTAENRLAKTAGRYVVISIEAPSGIANEWATSSSGGPQMVWQQSELKPALYAALAAGGQITSAMTDVGDLQSVDSGGQFSWWSVRRV